MDAEFVRERITQLRLQKDVSEYKMSYDLGHSRGYINNISSGKTLPCLKDSSPVLRSNTSNDTVHEMARDEARHGKALKGLLERYFK